jgi:hypothetical protein
VFIFWFLIQHQYLENPSPYFGAGKWGSDLSSWHPLYLGSMLSKGWLSCGSQGHDLFGNTFLKLGRG